MEFLDESSTASPIYPNLSQKAIPTKFSTSLSISSLTLNLTSLVTEFQQQHPLSLQRLSLMASPMDLQLPLYLINFESNDISDQFSTQLCLTPLCRVPYGCGQHI